MTFPIVTLIVRSEHDVMLARQRARQVASLLGFDNKDQTRIATAVSEITRNALEHGGGGRAEFQVTCGIPQSLKVVVKDSGPGIVGLDEMLAREACDGETRGVSLRGAQRLMDGFEVDSFPSLGTHVTLFKDRYRSLPTLQAKEIAALTANLMQRATEDPLVELQRQNQELLTALQELRLRDEERQEHLSEIEKLNARLRRAMTETHHRVKNNLQLISALIDMQSDDDDSVPASERSRLSAHVRALGVIHDVLTREAKANVLDETLSVKTVLDQVLHTLQTTVARRHDVSFSIEDARLPGHAVTALAIIANELVANAMKHGQGKTIVQFYAGEDQLRLIVRDNGQGFAEGFDSSAASHTGLMLVESITRHDLRGQVEFETHAAGGGCVTVTFPAIGAGVSAAAPA